MSGQSSSQNQSQSEQKWSALLRILKATTTLPAQATFYTAALGAIALTAGSDLPPNLAILASSVGVNALSSILERVAKGELSGEEIRQQVQAAIDGSGIANELTVRDTQVMVARLFRRHDILRSTIQSNEYVILQRLTEQAKQYKAFIAELRNDVTTIHTEIQKLATRQQSDEIINLLQRLLTASETIKRSVQIAPRRFNTSNDLKTLTEKPPVDFVIITALEEERNAVLGKLQGYQKLPSSVADIRVYFSADLPITSPGGPAITYRVIVLLSGVGRVNAAAATGDAIRRWNPRYVILVGIAGGVAEKGVELGDVLIADQIVDYELQKQTPEGTDIRWEVHRPDPRLLEAARSLADEEWQTSIAVDRPDGEIPKRHIGLIASGDKVIAFKDALTQYRATWSKLIGVEMEAGGAAAAAFQASSQPGFLVVRGVSDLADAEKGSPEVEKWRSNACDVAAAYTIALLKSTPIPPISNVQHSEISPDFSEIGPQLGELPKRISETEQVIGLKHTAKTQVTSDFDVEPVSVSKSLAPFVRTIEYQEQLLTQFKNASEQRIKRQIDEAVALIGDHRLKDAQDLLETLRDEEFPNVPNLEEIDPSLGASLYRLLGLCRLRVGDLNAASANFEVAKSIEGETEKLRKALLEYHVIKGNFDVVSKMAYEMLATDPESIEAKNALAVIQLVEGNFETVVKSYEAKSQADEDPSAQNILSIAYMELGNLPLALEKAQRSTELDPKSPHVYTLLGNAQLAIAYVPVQRQIGLRVEWLQEILDKDSLHEAIKSYEKALELYTDYGQHPWERDVNFYLASALSSNGRSNKALELINENIKNAPEPHVQNYILKAKFEDELGEPDCAIKTCKHALKLFPNDYRLMATIGELYLVKEDSKQARMWFENAEANCAVPREIAYLKILRSRTYIIQKDREGSEGCLREIPATEQDEASSFLAFGDHHSHFKNYSEAESFYQKALAKDPDNLAILDRLVRFHRRLQQPDKALAHAKRFFELVDKPATYISYVGLLAETGKTQDALSVLERANQRGFDNPAFKYHEAMLRQQIEQFSEAVELYEEYLEHEPEDFAATFNLGMCYQSQGDREKAIQTFISAEKLRPDDAQVHIALARIYRIEGDRQKAYDHAARVRDLVDEPDMHLFFFQVAYFCGYEEEAIKALMEVPKRFPEYKDLKIVSIEEAKEIRASSQEQYRQVKNFYQSGNLPLALVARWLNKPLPFIWRIFSQDSDVQILCALGNYEEQRSSLTTASQSTQVVIDYSALCTLCHLNLLDLPPRIFEKVYLSQSVFDQIQRDIEFLSLPVLSDHSQRLESISTIIHQHPKFRQQAKLLESSLALDAKQMEDIQPHTEQDILLAKQLDALYLLDNPLIFASVEQVLPNQSTTTERLLDYLYQNGKLKQMDYDNARKYLAKTHRLSDSGMKSIDNFDTIVISYLTMDVLLELDLFSFLESEFDAIYVSIPTLFLLRRDIEEKKFEQELLRIVKEIESAIKNHDGYCVQATTLPEKIKERFGVETIDEDFFKTFALAEELQLPIWTDDLASRKLAAVDNKRKIETFDTRMTLDVAINKGHLTNDRGYNATLSLLRWGFHFIPINSSIIYWSAEQHNFCFNEDTDLLFSSLDKSVANAHREWLNLIKRIDEINTEQLDYQTNLLARNLRIYADFLLHLWYKIPPENKRVRSKWTGPVLVKAYRSTDSQAASVTHLIVICISNMLQGFDDEKLDHFLAFCTSPYTPPSLELVDDAILFVLGALYNEGDYGEHSLAAASKLLNNLREAQYLRVTAEVRMRIIEFYKAILSKSSSAKQST
jgi:nucleoside phosphorylase/tetratricopeptide (TPR) repeat protein